MNWDLFSSTAKLIGEIFLSPYRAFEKIKNNIYVKEVYMVFLLGALITFLKTFSLDKQTVTFFADKGLNQFFSLLSTPQIVWGILQAAYFLFILGTFTICIAFKAKPRFNPLALSIMSISALGVVMQLIFIISRLVLPRAILDIILYPIYIWVIILTILAIKNTQNLSISKSFICFLIPALPFVLLAIFVGISPYLAWIDI